MEGHSRIRSSEGPVSQRSLLSQKKVSRPDHIPDGQETEATRGPGSRTSPKKSMVCQRTPGPGLRGLARLRANSPVRIDHGGFANDRVTQMGYGDSRCKERLLSKRPVGQAKKDPYSSNLVKASAWNPRHSSNWWPPCMVSTMPRSCGTGLSRNSLSARDTARVWWSRACMSNTNPAP